MNPPVHDSLLVIVAQKHEAEYIQSALLVRSISSEVRRGRSVIEFGGVLGASPYEVYVQSADLVAAKRVLEGLRWTGIAARRAPLSD